MMRSSVLVVVVAAETIVVAGGSLHRRAIDPGDVLGPALAAVLLDDLELDRFAVSEALEAVSLDRAEVDEYIIAAVGGLNEAEALLRVEPLHRTGHAGREKTEGGEGEGGGRGRSAATGQGGQGAGSTQSAGGN